jgi:hypothetical protein
VGFRDVCCTFPSTSPFTLLIPCTVHPFSQSTQSAGKSSNQPQTASPRSPSRHSANTTTPSASSVRQPLITSLPNLMNDNSRTIRLPIHQPQTPNPIHPRPPPPHPPPTHHHLLPYLHPIHRSPHAPRQMGLLRPATALDCRVETPAVGVRTRRAGEDVRGGAYPCGYCISGVGYGGVC